MLIPRKQDFHKKNFDYYYNRTSHGSTLSRVVFSALAEKIGYKRIGYKLFLEALSSDFNDIQGGTTREGIHTGVMASTVLVVIKSYAGIDLQQSHLIISPNLPKNWKKIKFRLNFKTIPYKIEITHDYVKIKVGILPVENNFNEYLIEIYGERNRITNSEWNTFFRNSDSIINKNL